MIRRILGPYGIIAGLCVLAHLGILVGGEELGLHFVVSTTISFIVCVIIGYCLHSQFTFKQAKSFRSFLFYTMAMSLNYPLSILAVWFFNQFLQQQMIIAAPASTLALTLYNFFSSKWAIGNSAFKTEKQGVIRERS